MTHACTHVHVIYMYYDVFVYFFFSVSPSLRHLQVARGWSTRRHSYTGGKLLRSSAESPKPEERKEKSVMATLTLEDLLHELETSTNVFDQTDILHILHDN